MAIVILDWFPVQMDLLETNNADEFVERQAIGVSEHRRIRRETSHRGQSTMDLFDGHRDLMAIVILDWFACPARQEWVEIVAGNI
jgi:hypothetical protein